MKGAIELGVNFLIVTIISIALIGLGVYLLWQGVGVGTQLKDQIDDYHKAEILKAMDDGRLVITYPRVAEIARGEHYIFTIGVVNELGIASSFVLYVEPKNDNGESKVLYDQAPFMVENRQRDFKSIRIEIPRTMAKGSYLYNICLINENVRSGAMCSTAAEYGGMQVVQLNVR